MGHVSSTRQGFARSITLHSGSNMGAHVEGHTFFAHLPMFPWSASQASPLGLPGPLNPEGRVTEARAVQGLYQDAVLEAGAMAPRLKRDIGLDL